MTHSSHGIRGREIKQSTKSLFTSGSRALLAGFMSHHRNRLQIWVVPLLIVFTLLTLLFAYAEAALADQTERHTVSATTEEIPLGPPIVIEKNVPVIGKFLISIPPPALRLSYDLEVELRHPTTVRLGSLAKYEVTVKEAKIRPALKLASGELRMGMVSVQLQQRTFNADFSFPPGQAVTLPLAPGISVPMTLVTRTQIKASTGATVSSDIIEWTGLGTHTFEVQPSAAAKPGDTINIVLDFSMRPQIGLSIDFKQVGQLFGLPALSAVPGLPPLIWTVGEITLGVVTLSPPISTSIEVVKAPFLILPIVIVAGLIVVAVAIVIIIVLRRRAS